MVEERFLQRLTDYIGRMPSLPTTVMKVVAICNDANTSPAELSKVISMDPVLMGNVLRLINSAYYGLSQKITSLVRAIIMLGLNTVKNLTLSTAVVGVLGGGKPGHALDLEEFWKHSLCVGVTAKLIAKLRQVPPRMLEEYFVAGLLHDVGKIPLSGAFATEYGQTLSRAQQDGLSLHLAEELTLKLNHAAVGNLIASNWKLGPELSDVITHHHAPEEYQGEYRDILYAVAMANHFANARQIGFSGNRFPAELSPGIPSYLNVSPDFLEGVKDEVTQEIDRAKVFLNLKV